MSHADPSLSDSVVRFWCPELIQEGQWHHVVLVLNRAVLKNSSVSLYVDGQHISTQKVCNNWFGSLVLSCSYVLCVMYRRFLIVLEVFREFAMHCCSFNFMPHLLQCSMLI